MKVQTEVWFQYPKNSVVQKSDQVVRQELDLAQIEAEFEQSFNDTGSRDGCIENVVRYLVGEEALEHFRNDYELDEDRTTYNSFRGSTDNWAVVKVVDGEKVHWLFWLKDGMGKFRKFPIPTNCQIDKEGNITITDDGYVAKFNSLYDIVVPWPSVLVNPTLAVTYHRLRQFLEPSDVSPIRGLLRGREPEKTMGNQIKVELQEIERRLFGDVLRETMSPPTLGVKKFTPDQVRFLKDASGRISFLSGWIMRGDANNPSFETRQEEMREIAKLSQEMMHIVLG